MSDSPGRARTADLAINTSSNIPISCRKVEEPNRFPEALTATDPDRTRTEPARSRSLGIGVCSRLRLTSCVASAAEVSLK
jgi:hypothetical protein